MITIIISVTTIYTLFLFLTPLEYQGKTFHILLFIVLVLLIWASVYMGAREVTKELKIVEQ